MIETSKKGKNTFSAILSLKNEIHDQMLTFGKKAETAQKLINYLYTQPFVNLGEVMQALAVSKQSANQIIKDFMNKGILVEVTGNQRNRIYYFKKYYDLFVV